MLASVIQNFNWGRIAHPQKIISINIINVNFKKKFLLSTNLFEKNAKKIIEYINIFRLTKKAGFPKEIFAYMNMNINIK